MATVFLVALSMACSAQPVNDNFANRIFLTGYTNDVLDISTVGATGEKGEPNQNLVAYLYPSVWYSWTAPAAGKASLSYSGDSYLRYFAVFTGTQLRSLHEVVKPNDGPGFDVKAGEVFQIQVMAPTTTPPFDMHLYLDPRPANDNFTNRTYLTGSSVMTNGNTYAATREPGEPWNNGLSFGRSVWYSWTAPASGWLFVNLSDCPPLVCAAYTGDSLQHLRRVPGILLDDNPFSSLIAVEAGVQYQFAVDGTLYFDKSVYAGSFTLNLDFTGLTLLTPVNNSVLVAPTPIELLATNTLPNIDGNIEDLSFYALNLLSEQELPLGDSSGPLFNLSWTNPPGGYYQIQAFGTNTDGNPVQSSPAIIAIRPQNDDFANRIILEGTNAAWSVNFDGATRVKSDPPVAKFLNDDFNGSTLWWTWTAPSDGTVTLNCDNWRIALGVYLGHPGGFKTVMKPIWGTGQFVAKAGTTYQILLSDRFPATSPSQGNVTLTLEP